MPTSVLLIGSKLSNNLGGPSLFVSTKQALDQFIPDAQYTLISLMPDDPTAAHIYDVKILYGEFIRAFPTFLLKRFMGISVGPNAYRDLVNAFIKADIIIDIRGIAFCDSILNNKFLTRMAEGLHFLLAKLFHKPVVKYTSDIGPFESKWNKFFSRFYLQRFVDLVLARNESTRQRLAHLRLPNHVLVCPDTAFLLKPSESAFASDISHDKSSHPIVGISVSYKSSRQIADSDLYVSAVAGLADYMVNTISAKIILIPNVYSKNPLADDTYVAQQIRKHMACQGETIILPPDFNAWQMKGIIGKCDVLVASRYHSIVAALSQGIPVLAIGWHDKYSQILALFGLEDNLCMVNTLTLNRLCERFDSIWLARHQLQAQIKSAIPGITQRISFGARQVKLLLDKKSLS